MTLERSLTSRRASTDSIRRPIPDDLFVTNTTTISDDAGPVTRSVVPPPKRAETAPPERRGLPGATAGYQTVVSTPLVIASNRLPVTIEVDEQGAVHASPSAGGLVSALRLYADQLQAYFRGELREFTCQLDLIGTDFQKKCWNALLRIPYGKTCSYADIARQVGSPRGFRAVGRANHDNPIPIIVPCHRVITSSGTLGGYGGGLNVKEQLLQLESAQQSFTHL